MNKFTKKHSDKFYFVFRIFIGLLFIQHGLQKLFGAFGGVNGGSVQFFSIFGLAGTIEFLGGLLIVLGLFTRFIALISGIEMIVAYFRAHFPKGAIPLINGGELALLFLAAFLILLAHGAGKWALDNTLFRKKSEA